MADTYQVGNRQSRNIYRVAPDSTDPPHDEFVAVAFDPAFGPVVAEALTLLAAQREISTAIVPRRFHLVRSEDVSGVSGTGIVAEGAQWSDGTVTVRWFGEHSSVVQWRSRDDALAIHGHDGRTRLLWLDQERPLSTREHEATPPPCAV